MYDHERSIASAYADRMFRWLASGDLVEEDTGSVDAPMGHVARIRVDEKDIAEYASEFGDPWVTEAHNVETGWYLITTTDTGVVWAHYYGSADSTQDLANQIVDFREIERAYAVWSVAD